MTKQSDIDALAADIREIDGDHSIGAATLASALIDMGWMKRPVKALIDYRSGDYCEVFVVGHGVWVPGRVSEVIAGLPSVNTEYGPVTVSSLRRIRAVQ